jgi:hypothetical protein
MAFSARVLQSKKPGIWRLSRCSQGCGSGVRGIGLRRHIIGAVLAFNNACWVVSRSPETCECVFLK